MSLLNRTNDNKSLREQALIFTLDLHVMIDAETTR